jgi:plastocyanin
MLPGVARFGLPGGVARVLLAAVAIAFVLPAPPAAAAQEVAIQDNDFVPDEVKVGPGGEVHWARASGANNQHNVSQDDGLFRSGNPTFGAIDFTITVSGGTYPYRCEIHGLSMAGEVKGKLKKLDAPGGPRFTIRWATDTTDTGSAFDVQYRVGSGNWKTWKANTTELEDVFGTGGDPVTVQTDKTYRLRARSQEGADVSDWSPIRTVHT